MVFYRVTDPDFKNVLSRISSLWRRYTEFELLRAYLEISYPYIVLPPLPEKKVLYAWQKVTTDTFDPDFVDRRRAGLEVCFHYISNNNYTIRILKKLRKYFCIEFSYKSGVASYSFAR